MNTVTDLALAIDDEDRTLHVGPATAVLAHLRASDGEQPESVAHASAESAGADRPVLRVYDSQGRPLGTEGVRASDATVDESTLLRRIETALAHMQSVLDEDPGRFQAGPDAPEVTAVPRPQGSLQEVLQQLAEAFALQEKDDPRNKGNWFHMLAHAAGTAHR